MPGIGVIIKNPQTTWKPSGLMAKVLVLCLKQRAHLKRQCDGRPHPLGFGKFFRKKIASITYSFLIHCGILAIHPFQDGNGRLSRVLTTYLLLKYGYTYVPYCSLEAVIEQSKENYYLALRQTQGTLKSDHPNWRSWTPCFLKALLQQKHRLEVKLERKNC